MTPIPWPEQPPLWLQSWTIWRFLNMPQPRPVGVPTAVPKWTWDWLKWCEWRRAGADPAKRPDVDPTVPKPYWAILTALNQAVPVPPKPPVPPPPPPPPPPPIPIGANPLNHGRTAYVTWGVHNGSLGTAGQMVRNAKAKGFTRVAFQATPDNDFFAEAVRLACASEGVRYAVWFDCHAPGDQLAVLDWYKPQEYLMNIESFARDTAAEVARIRAAHPDLPLGTVTNFWGLTPELVKDSLIPAGVVCHAEAYRYEPGMDRPQLELELLDFAHRVLGWAFEDIQLVLGLKVGEYTVADYHDYDPNRYGIYPLEYL
jgi:hypothetical protein